KKLGINLVRLPIRPFHPQWLRLADELGMMCMEESSWTAFGEDDFKSRKDTWSAVMLRDRNRPSVVIWTLYNESWGIKFVDELVHFVKQLDPTRLLIDNTGGAQLNAPNYPGNHGLTDIEDIHHYPGFNWFDKKYWLDLKRVNPDHPLM